MMVFLHMLPEDTEERTVPLNSLREYVSFLAHTRITLGYPPILTYVDLFFLYLSPAVTHSSNAATALTFYSALYETRL